MAIRRILILLLTAWACSAFCGVVAGPPALTAPEQVFGAAEYSLPASFELTARDPDPGDVVTFDLVDPATGEASALVIYLMPADPLDGVFRAEFHWDVLPEDAGVYPLRAVARDGNDETATADFILKVFAASDDITVPEIVGPAAAEVFSEDNPDPHVYEIVASSASGQSLEYQLNVTPPSGSPQLFPFQPSPLFPLTFTEPGIYTLRAEARSAASLFWPNQTAWVLAWAGGVVPPAVQATYALSGPGRLTVEWPSHPDNTTITAYRLILYTVYNAVPDPIVHEVPVPDPVNEPAMWSFEYDFANDPVLIALIAGINSVIADIPSTFPFVRVGIEAVTDDPETPWPYMPIGPVQNLVDILPHVTEIRADYDPETRGVLLTLGDLVLPSGSGTAGELVLYPAGFGSFPANGIPVADPVAGMTLALTRPDDGQPIAAGNAPASVLALLRNTGADLPGVLQPFATPIDAPQCWDGVDNDGDGLTDLDAGDPGCVSRTDPYEYDLPDGLDLPGRALIVYNVNTTDAAGIAEHYRAARGLDMTALCPVALPPGHYASADELLGARRTMLETCVCRNVLGRFEHECDGVTGEALAADSPVTHLVLIRGVPARLTGTPWSSNGEEPSFDYYLAWSLYNDDALFSQGETGSVPHGPYDGTLADDVDYQPSTALDARVRAIDPALDRLVAYGRIEALTGERTRDLIDRTLAAEASGVGGSFLEQGGAPFEFFRRLTTSLASECRAASYIEDPDTDWPHLTCRAGTSERGLIPGRPSAGGKLQSIPFPVDAGIYLGNGLPSGGHKAFNGFPNMIRWRRVHPDDETVPCTPLCADRADPADVAACRAASTDWFHEIDTDCVGVASGFLGWQLRSWPVQYYGFHPAGWFTDSGGHTEKTPPRHMPGAAWGDTYLRFGGNDAATDPLCVPHDAPLEPVPCPERIAVSLGTSHVFAEPLVLDAPRSLVLRFHYRRGRPAGGQLQARLEYRRDDGERFFETIAFDVSAARSEWTLAEATFTAPLEAGPVRHVTLSLRATLFDTLTGGWFDLDNVELLFADDPFATNLLDADAASFELPQRTTHHGDWAANVIDRLGGIAWWGSGSHHQTGGWAFHRSADFAGAFFSGRTLGESLMYLGKNARSGTIYGDPLYRPSGVKLFVGDGLAPLNRAGAGYSFFEEQPDSFDPAVAPLRINAFHGSARLESSRWAVAKCFGTDLLACHRDAAWLPVESSDDRGVNGVYDYALDTTLLGLIDPDRWYEDQAIVLWLRVWNPGEEADDLSDYGYLRYVAAANHPPLALDARIEPHDAGVGETLTATWSFDDVDGDLEDASLRTIRWSRNDAHDPAWDQSVEVAGTAVALGDTWQFELTVSDGALAAPVAVSLPLTIECRGPALPLTIVAMNLDGAGDTVFVLHDPNPATRVSGYRLYRGLTPSELAPVGDFAPDPIVDAGSAAGELWFYTVSAINADCDVEGP